MIPPFSAGGCLMNMRGERRRPTPHLGDRLHARNRYKDNAPDFYALGQRFPDFLQYLRNVNHEKKTAALPFNDPYAVRELSRTLLKHDFGLDWTMPIDRLCPPLPNRLNYIHWIEDLLHAGDVDPFSTTSDTVRAASSSIRGIDIGTGASCIYALLGAKMNNWSFLATEIDGVSYQSAHDNVTRNKLSDLIHVKHVATSRLLLEPLDDAPADYQDHQIHFSMCNPPFFDDINEADTNPDAACMGSSSEMVVPGGEVEFIGHMIEDSLQLRDRVLVYTSMIGRKSSLRKVLAILRDKAVDNVCSIEFFQGRTKRWGVAWSFVERMNLKEQAKVLGKRKEAQRRNQFEFSVPYQTAEAEHGCRTLVEVVERVKAFIEAVKDQSIAFTELEPESSVYLITARKVAADDDDAPELETTIELEATESDDGFAVTLEFESGKRDECWRFCESLKAATIRSGRHWRRKRAKLAEKKLPE